MRVKTLRGGLEAATLSLSTLRAHDVLRITRNFLDFFALVSDTEKQIFWGGGGGRERVLSVCVCSDFFRETKQEEKQSASPHERAASASPTPSKLLYR